MKLRSALVALLFALPAAAPATAADEKAAFLIKLFADACIQTAGDPSAVRAWAADHKLTPVQDPHALELFVGPGSNGAAWAAPTTFGNFALAIRGNTQGCAAYARTADPGEVEGYFKRIVEGAARPGVELSVVRDTTQATAAGAAHSLVYKVDSPGSARSFLFILVTTERFNGTFQAKVEEARAVDPPGPPQPVQ